MEQKIELKTCPYCGNKDITTIFVNPEFKGTDREEEFCFWVARCIKCKALGKSGKTENEAVQKWNDECASSKMERLTDTAWKNLDPWECCGQDDYCQRGCHDEGGCTNGCIVSRVYRRLAAYEDTGLTPEEIKTLQEDDVCRNKTQIPQKPILTTECKGFTNYILTCECPNCHKDIIKAGWANYCYHCGQALDWVLQGRDGE